jgi:hypothetical protein
MFVRRNMPEMPNIPRPSFRRRIHCTRNQELAGIELMGRLNEQLFKRGLPVGRIGSEI